MNEVSKIHLGRQAFAISADAHRDLRNYLDAIKRRVHDDDVVNEVELRMAELLAERGVTGDKVILSSDVTYLKEQLGDPKDFAEDGEAEPAPEKPVGDTDAKRLFRDTDNAMLAGVAAGLASYFGVDVLLVRLLFIVATFAGGWGILIYIVLWLLVPEAKTPSDRLLMTGRAVTIDNLKEAVERADVKGATARASKSLAGPVNTLFSAILKIIGVCLVATGLAMLLSLAGGAAYAFLRSGAVVQSDIFPVSLKDHLLIYIAAGVIAMIALFVVVFGMALFWRKWPIHAWLTGTLIGLMLIGIAVGGALAADIVPQVRDRYNADIHTSAHRVPTFSQVNLDNVDGQVSFQSASTYSVSYRYFGHPNLSSINTSISKGVLTIDTRQFDQNRHCQGLCIPNSYNLQIIISSPQQPTVIYPGVPEVPVPPAPPQLQD